MQAKLIGLIKLIFYGFLITLFLSPTIAVAKSNVFCAIEIGSKGVKARLYSLTENQDGYLDVDTRYKENVNTTIIASIKDGNFSTEAIEETAKAVKSEVDKMKKVDNTCTAFIVGSSGIAKANNKQLLADKIKEKTNLSMNFITPDDEAVFGFIASVPVKYRQDSLLVDIGSGNTKIAFAKDGQIETYEIPFGTVSLTKELQEKHAVDFNASFLKKLKQVVQSSLNNLKQTHPELAQKKRIYWIGGAAWATATYTYPEFSEKLAVRIYKKDINKFFSKLNKNQWMDTSPPKKTSAEALKIHNKHWDKVKSIFTRENLLSALSLMSLVVKETDFKDRINFLRNGQWLYGYTRQQFMSKNTITIKPPNDEKNDKEAKRNKDDSNKDTEGQDVTAPSPTKTNKADVYCAIEIGSKGVKARLYVLSEDEEGYLDVDTRYKEEVNTTIVASMQQGKFSNEAIKETAIAVSDELKNMQDINTSCITFIVGSSGIAKANNKKSLANKIKKKTGLSMIFITPDDEAVFGFIASVPVKYRQDSLLVDIGSGNTKIAFAKNGQIETHEIPFGTVSLTKELQEKHDVDFNTSFLKKIKEVVLPSIITLKKNHPELAKKKRIYWIGGAAWATTTYTYPEFSEKIAVRIYKKDISQFFKNLKKNQWMDTTPPKKTSAAALNIHNKHWEKVKSIFTRENLLSALSLMSLVVKETGNKDRINFLRNGQWLYGYTREQFVSNQANNNNPTIVKPSIPKKNSPADNAKIAINKISLTPNGKGKWKVYCAIEIGSKGVKSRIYEMSKDKEGYIKVKRHYKKEVNTTIIASMQQKKFSDEAIIETTEVVSSELKKMQAAVPSCISFAVGSSSVAKADNKQELVNKVQQLTGLTMKFVTPKDEAIYGFASVPTKYRKDSLLVDMGSGNTKIAFLQNNKVKSVEIPFGSVTLTDKLQQDNTDFSGNYQKKINDILLKDFRIQSVVNRNPRLANHKRLYWIGGASWATATYTYPEFSKKLAVRIYRRDINRFIRNLEKEQWMDTLPPKKISQEALKIHKKEWDEVKSAFTRENLLSALTMFDIIVKQGNQKSRINFLRRGQWIYGYTREKFNQS